MRCILTYVGKCYRVNQKEYTIAMYFFFANLNFGRDNWVGIGIKGGEFG